MQLNTSIKTPADLYDILGRYAPIKSTIAKMVVIRGQCALYFELDIAQLTEQQFRGLTNHTKISPRIIKERGFFLPALKNSTTFGVPD